MGNMKLLGLSMVACLGLSLTAQAEDFSPKFYMGLGLGKTSTDTGVKAATGTAKLDEDDAGYKLYGGVQLNKYLSIEGFYADLGDATLSGNNGDTFAYKGTTYTFTASGKIGISATSIGIAPVVGYDVNDWFRPFAKVGLHRWKMDANVATNAGSASLAASGTDFMAGLGADFAVTDNISIRAEAERFSMDISDVDLLSVGVSYRF